MLQKRLEKAMGTGKTPSPAAKTRVVTPSGQRRRPAKASRSRPNFGADDARRVIAISALLLVALLLPFSGALSCSGQEEGAHLQETPASLPEPPKSEEIPGLSTEQARMVREHGYPDHFFISIDPSTGDRMERWTYFSLGKAYDFYNGRLDGEEPVEDESSSYPSTPYKPQDFTSDTTPQLLENTLGQPLLRHELKNSLLSPNLMLVYPQAVFLFRDGKLMGVDTKIKPPSLLQESSAH